MASISKARLLREVADVSNAQDLKDLGISIETVDNVYELRAWIQGPPDTPYKNGRFQLSVIVPQEYPFKAPMVKFVTKVWHPNISSMTGAICLDVLKENWCASMTLRSVLLSIQSMLCSPEPNNPQDAVVAAQYLEDKELFKATATYWAQYFASAPGDRDPEKVAKINKMVQDTGKIEETVLTALSANGWDVDRAANYIAP